MVARLVVLPEYFLTGFPMGDTVPGWRDKAALDIKGPEYDALARIAADFDLYLAGNAYEVDPNFPELYFQCCFVLGPGGEVVLRASAAAPAEPPLLPCCQARCAGCCRCAPALVHLRGLWRQCHPAAS